MTSIYFPSNWTTYALYFKVNLRVPSGVSLARGAFCGVRDSIIPWSVNYGKVVVGKPLRISDGSIISLFISSTLFILGIWNVFSINNQE